MRKVSSSIPEVTMQEACSESRTTEVSRVRLGNRRDRLGERDALWKCGDHHLIAITTAMGRDLTLLPALWKASRNVPVPDFGADYSRYL